MKTSQITLTVSLNDNSVPRQILWLATEGQPEPRECKAFLLSLWDKAEEGSFRIDLWVQDLRVDEMSRLVHQSLLTMAETYAKATGNQALAAELRAFGNDFGKKAGIIP